jgi:hypothetical protein
VDANDAYGLLDEKYHEKDMVTSSLRAIQAQRVWMKAIGMRSAAVNFGNFGNFGTAVLVGQQ